MSTHHKADLLLLLTTILAAAGWIFSREAVQGLAPLLFMALRFVSAGLILAAIGWSAMRMFNGQQWKSACLVGSFFGTALTFWILALEMTSHVGIGAFLTGLGVVLVPLISLFFGDRSGPYVYLSIPFVITGLACLSLDSEFHLGLAELFFLLSALLFSFTFILNSRAATRLPALPLTAVQLLITGLITGTISLLIEDWNFNQPPAIWGWLIASALIATSLRFLVQTHAQSLAPPSHTAIIMTLEPVWTALLAALWLGESMTTLQFSGCALIFLAMLVNRWPAVRAWLKHH
ncbi:Threonine/homoserine efflux transporter RhtA [Marinobacterium sediminicola]|uniref:Threonine/homoserine efflux transporter RhtA n=1 Tax=Marinobacterium sediminicola TaxID=518898 RepID=A0ABY1S2A6_9GAMM|nr:Threonine/homoserine efflux transporter RhtA [Marinobacterium sediminicola]